MNIKLRLDFDITPRARQALRSVLFCILLPVAVFAGTSSIANAWTSDTTWIATGQPLSSTRLRTVLVEADARLAALEAMQIPAGTVNAFAGTVVPPGWLLCDGSATSRAAYPALFAAIGTAHGSGDGATTFTVPDYRGRFLRGVDGTATRDPDHGSRSSSTMGGNTGNQVGSVQDEQFKGHSHNVQDLGHQHSLGLSLCSGQALAAGPIMYATSTSCPTHPTSAPSVANLSQVPGGGNETRPANAYVNYIIKT
ncbi:MAG: Tail Collar domain protein [Myxococcales bacterium]|nr:Tail Collar domain protein [Myxococcales bacterium]